jgi:hypothetical protein
MTKARDTANVINNSNYAAKNYVINGDMSLAQRGTGSASTIIGAGQFLVDRWGSNLYQAANMAQTLVNDNALPTTYALRIGSCSSTQLSGGTSWHHVLNTIDGPIVKQLLGQKVTVSFWLRCSAASFTTPLGATGPRTLTSISSSLEYYDTATPDMATTFPVSYSPSLNISGGSFPTVWTRYSHTTTIPTTIKAVGVGFQTGPDYATTNASDFWWEITGVQVEIGAAATNFVPHAGDNRGDAAITGGAGFDGVLVSTNGDTASSRSGTLGWSGYQVAGKNYIINGGLDVWARGTSIAFSNADYVYGADRFHHVRGGFVLGATVTRQTTADTTNLPNIRYCMRVQRDSGNTSVAGIYADHGIETANSIPLAGKPVTLSFYARKGANYSETSSSMFLGLYYGTSIDKPIRSFTGGGQLAVTFPLLTTSWQRFTLTAVIPSSATQVGISMGYTPAGTAGANDYFEATGIQLEQGSTASSFSRAGGSIGAEEALCKRYYYRQTGGSGYQPVANGFASSSTNVMGYVLFPVPMRTTPYAIDYSILQSNDSTVGNVVSAVAFSGTEVGPNGATVNFTTSGMTTFRPCKILQSNNAAGYLGFNAELS